jgi:hypothetical protein
MAVESVMVAGIAKPKRGRRPAEESQLRVIRYRLIAWRETSEQQRVSLRVMAAELSTSHQLLDTGVESVRSSGGSGPTGPTAKYIPLIACKTRFPSVACKVSRNAPPGEYQLLPGRNAEKGQPGPGLLQGRGVTEVDFQIDGNLVAYAGSTPVYASGTSGNANATLYIQDDGNPVIYKQGNIPIFATNTSAFEAPGKNV